MYGKPASASDPLQTAGAALGYMGAKTAGDDSDSEEEKHKSRTGQQGRGSRSSGRAGGRRKKSAAELGVGKVLHTSHAGNGGGGGGAAVTNAGVEHLLETVKRKMKKRGVNGALGLRRFVRLADTDGDGEVDLQEFVASMESLSMGLTPREARLLFQYFDKDGSGTISFEEFQVAICGNLNERRRMLVLKAFRKLDADGSGIVDTNDIKVTFSADKHPAVVSGLQTPDEVMQEFLSTFDGHGEGAGDGMVTEQEFLDYYRGISMVIDEDDHFELLVRNAWQLPGGQGYAQFVTGGQGGHEEMGALSKQSNFMDAQLQLAKQRTSSLDQLRGPQRTVQLQLNKMGRRYERQTRNEKARYRSWAGLENSSNAADRRQT